MKTKNVLIDTSIILDSIENITDIDKDANVFVTDIVLRELDGNKGTEGSKGYNAREFFRQFKDSEFNQLDKIPLTEEPLNKNDMLTIGQMGNGTDIFTITRQWYRSKDINDTKIIEVAKDYDLDLNTIDQAQCMRAKTVGVNAELRESIHETEVKPNFLDETSRIEYVHKFNFFAFIDISFYFNLLILIFSSLLIVFGSINIFTSKNTDNILLLTGIVIISSYILYETFNTLKKKLFTIKLKSASILDKSNWKDWNTYQKILYIGFLVGIFWWIYSTYKYFPELSLISSLVLILASVVVLFGAFKNLITTENDLLLDSFSQDDINPATGLSMAGGYDLSGNTYGSSDH